MIRLNLFFIPTADSGGPASQSDFPTRRCCCLSSDIPNRCSAISSTFEREMTLEF